MNITVMKFSDGGLKEFFTPILTEWFQILDKYPTGTDEPDTLFWYNERAILSTLAGAAWRCGCYALEEYSSTKKKDGKTKKGRTDLWLQCDDTEYTIEAKQEYVSISDQTARISQIISEVLEAARRDAGQSKEDQIQALGILFVAPYFPISSKNEADNLVKYFINQLNLVQECDLLAYFFSDEKHLVEEEDEKNYYPGIALLGKYA